MQIFKKVAYQKFDKNIFGRNCLTIMLYERHIFICTNQRAADAVRPCCGAEVGMSITRAFKKELKERGLNVRVRAQSTACFDICEHGPNVVVYPEGIFYGNVQVEDVREIVESHILAGNPVKRLVLDLSARE